MPGPFRRQAGPGAQRASTLADRTWYPENRTLRRIENIEDPDEQRDAFVRIIDRRGWNTKVFLVAASGFFTDSYNLFASNVILPSLAFVYFGANSQTLEITINALTLAGSAVGQILFGFLADRYGRQRLYGVELVIVIFCTLGLAASGPGVYDAGRNSMSVTGWIMFWRFIMGVGIGAEYPLSACITVEWSARQYRAQMMSAVFLMQPIGQFCAYGVGLAVLNGLQYREGYDIRGGGGEAKLGIDILWRVVTAVGGVPAVCALIFRWWIPESGRYTSDVKLNSERALKDTWNGVRRLFESKSAQSSNQNAGIVVRDDTAATDIQLRHVAGPVYDQPDQYQQLQTLPADLEAPQGDHRQYADNTDERLTAFDQPQQPAATLAMTEYSQGVANDPILPANGHAALKPQAVMMAADQFDEEEQKWTQFSRSELRKYFFDGGNWRYLFGACTCWFFLDFVFFGLGFNNPGTMAKLWTNHKVTAEPNTPFWLLDSAAVNGSGSIFTVIKWNGIEAIVTVSIWSIVGAALITNRINYIDRRFTLIWTSLALASLLLATAVAFPYAFHKPAHAVLIVLYALINFLFSYGPNTLTFIIPAEIFPTRYRCTCYGLAAAAGKLGAVCVQVVYLYFDGRQLTKPNSPALGLIMYLFAGFMLLVALAAWAYLPEVQERGPREEANTCIPGYVVENKPLEELAEGRSFEQEGQRTGFVERTGWLMQQVKSRRQRSKQHR